MSPDDVRKTRKALGMTRKRFGALIGVSRHTVQSWEQGRRTCKGPAVRAIQSLRSALDEGGERGD